MGVVFVLGVAGRLELEGGVFDVEVPDQAGLHLIQEAGGVPVVEAAIVDDHVRREGGQVGGDRPDVQVVDVDDVLVGSQMAADRIQVGALRRGLEKPYYQPGTVPADEPRSRRYAAWFHWRMTGVSRSYPSIDTVAVARAKCRPDGTSRPSQRAVSTRSR